jgi:hypothetical protein
MHATSEWENLQLAGAFLLGAILATIAVLRVVRAVTVLFEGSARRRRLRPPPPEQEEQADDA